MLTREVASQLGDAALKKVFFELPVRVEDESGTARGVRLSVYEDSDPERLAALFAERYGLPGPAAELLQLEIVRGMDSRTYLRWALEPGGAFASVAVPIAAR